MDNIILVWALVATAVAVYFAFGMLAAKARVDIAHAAVEYYLARIVKLHEALKQREREFSEFRHKG